MPRRHLDEYTIIPRTSDMVCNEDGTFGARHLSYDASGGEQTIVTPNGNYYTKKGKQYKSDGYGRNTSDYYNGNDIIDFVNGTVLNPLQLTSPYHWLGVARHWDKNKDIGQIFDPNSGIVSENFAKEHPYLTAGINMLADAVTGQGIKRSLRYAGNIKNKAFVSKNTTKTNVSKITDAQWDEAYTKAVNSGDMFEAQRLRDLHFVAKANKSKTIKNGSPVKTYHTVNEAYPANFNEFNPNIEGTHSAIYTSDSPIMSGTYTSRLVSDQEKEYYIQQGIENMKYQLDNGLVSGSTAKHFRELLKDNNKAREYVIEKSRGLKQNISPERQKQLYIKLDNPVITDSRGHNWNDISTLDLPEDVYKNLKFSDINNFGFTTRDLERAQRATRKYDGSIIENVVDYGGNWKSTMINRKPSTVYQVNEPNALKLADAITYDDIGNIIPLSKRDNFNIKDIRYGLIPTILGLGGYGAKRRLESNGKVSQ